MIFLTMETSLQILRNKFFLSYFYFLSHYRSHHFIFFLLYKTCVFPTSNCRWNMIAARVMRMMRMFQVCANWELDNKAGPSVTSLQLRWCLRSLSCDVMSRPRSLDWGLSIPWGWLWFHLQPADPWPLSSSKDSLF